MAMMKIVLTYGAMAMFFVSALLWFASTKATISAEKMRRKYQDMHGPDAGPAQIVGEDDSDFYATSQRQSQLSGWAAIATGLALLLQAIETAL